MKVFTYYEDVDGLNDPELLKLWKESWSAHGWHPIILTEHDAKIANPRRLNQWEHHTLLTSNNPHRYSRAILMRWLAMGVVQEPALHVDWDVICNGANPDNMIIDYHKPIFLAGNTCPCAIAGTENAWPLIPEIMDFVQHLPNFDIEALRHDATDQYAMSVIPEALYVIHPEKPCKVFDEDEGWEHAPMIHFPTRKTKYPRSKTIKKIFGL